MELSESNATGTWSIQEELLLAFAVKRHGLKNWEAVAMELQSRSNRSKNFLYAAGICKENYRNLRKRYVNRRYNHNLSGGATGGGGDDNNDVLDSDEDGGGEGGGESFWWLEELRKLRVAELKMEVQRYDLSIEKLQKTVKPMDEEGEKSLPRNEIDLDEEKEAEISENDKNNGEKATTAEVAGNSGSGEAGNRSFNESNSTDNTRTGFTNEPKPVEIKPNHDALKPVGEEDSDGCKDSSDSKERKKDGVFSAELVHSSSESKEGSHGTKVSSDMQSSASQLTRRNKRISKMDKVGNGGGGVGGGRVTGTSPATVPSKRGRGVGVKAEPIFGVLDVIRSHKHGNVFQRRLEIQKSRKYNNLIRQHVDLSMIKTRMEDGSYSSCPAKIYLDLLLLCNNAILFFPKSSSQSRVAHQLRQVITNHLKKHTPLHRLKSQPKRSDPLLVKQKSTAPIVVCKKRSSISSKPSSSMNKIEKQVHNKPPLNPKLPSNEEDGASKSKANEKPVVTGVRSARKSSNVRSRLSSPPRNSGEKPESSKALKEKATELNVNDKKKGAANFLKRINKNEPAHQALKTSGDSLKSGKKDVSIKKSNDVGRSSGGGGAKRADNVVQTSMKRIGRPPKKGKEVLKGKRDRDDVSEDEGSVKRPIKRSKR